MCGRVPQLWSPCRAPRFSPERAKLAVNQLEVLIFYGYFQGVVLQSVDLSLSSLESKLPSLPVTKEPLTLCLELLDLWPLTFVYEARHAIRALLAFVFGLRGCRLCRAEEIRLAWRKELQQRLGHDPHEDEASRAGPAEGVKVWFLCALFLAQGGWSFSPDFGWIGHKSWTRTGKWSVCICQCRRMILLWRVLGDP